MASKGAKQNGRNAKEGINQSCQGIIQFGCNHGRQCNADDHGDQLKGLTESVGFGAERVTGKEIREQGGVIGIDQGIQRTGQDIGDQKIDKQKRFCDEYLIDCNGTRAYKAAYPSVKKDNTAAAGANTAMC